MDLPSFATWCTSSSSCPYSACVVGADRDITGCEWISWALLALMRIFPSSCSSRGTWNRGSQSSSGTTRSMSCHTSSMILTMASCCSKSACISKLMMMGRSLALNAVSLMASATSRNPQLEVNLGPWRTTGSPLAIGLRPLVAGVCGRGSRSFLFAVDGNACRLDFGESSTKVTLLQLTLLECEALPRYLLVDSRNSS